MQVPVDGKQADPRVLWFYSTVQLIQLIGIEMAVSLLKKREVQAALNCHPLL